jgi:hypothetical protein
MVDRLMSGNLEDEAEFARRAFRDNDAWLALTGAQRGNQEADLLMLVACAVAILPGILFGIALLGALLFGIARLFERFERLQIMLQTPYAQAVGLVLSLVAYSFTNMPLVALTVALCFGFLAFEPVHTRSKPPASLGPFFQFTVLVLAVSFGGLVAVFWAGLTTPPIEVLSGIDFPMEFYGGQTLTLGLAGIIVSLLLLVGPSWAMVLRIKTPFATLVALRLFGANLFWGCLIAAVVSVPLSLYADVRVGEVLRKLLVNEPNYYLQQ